MIRWSLDIERLSKDLLLCWAIQLGWFAAGVFLGGLAAYVAWG